MPLGQALNDYPELTLGELAIALERVSYEHLKTEDMTNVQLMTAICRRMTDRWNQHFKPAMQSGRLSADDRAELHRTKEMLTELRGELSAFA